MYNGSSTDFNNLTSSKKEIVFFVQFYEKDKQMTKYDSKPPRQ